MRILISVAAAATVLAAASIAQVHTAKLKAGTEVIVGAKAEEGLGHLVMFGMGGIYVEILKDVVFKLTPLTDAEAGAMIDGVRLAPLLRGVRTAS